MPAQRNTPRLRATLRHAILLIAVVAIAAPAVQAQNMPPQRQLRTYIPPDQLVSFLPSTPFPTFLEILDPIVMRVTGKQLIDPETRDIAIGIPVTTTHFFDAFELVLYYNGLSFRETDKYFIVETATPGQSPGTGALSDGLRAENAALAAGVIPASDVPATLGTRQVHISAVLFEMNHTKAKEIGFDWSTVLGSQSSQGSSSSSSSSGTSGTRQDDDRVQFFLKTNDVFDGVSNLIQAPGRVNFSSINSIIRFAEANGIGETVASPDVNVQSGVQGRIQVGSDVPVQMRDFAGNTVTQFFSTGIIIEVTPTVISEAVSDTLGAPELEFIHLNVKVEKSGSRPSAAGLVIDRSAATTQVTMLDGEQIAIGGLFNNEESFSRTGIPVLKDLPGWFFGLRYIFGRTTTTVAQKELLIVLQAEVVDGIASRAGQPMKDNLLDARREQIQEALRRFNANVADEIEKPTSYSKRVEGNK